MNTAWRKETAKDPPMELQQLVDELAQVKIALAELRKDVTHSSQDRVALHESMEALRRSVESLTAQLAGFSQLQIQLQTQAGEIKTLRDDRSMMRGAFIVLGAMGTALLAGATKLLYDALTKHTTP